MSDYLLRLAGQPTLRNVIKSVGLPTPVELKRAGARYADQPLAGLQVLFGTAKDAAVATAVRGELEGAGATVIAQAAEGAKYDALVLDVTEIDGVDGLKQLYSFFHPVMRQIAANARLLVLASEPAEGGNPKAVATARATEGFVRSIGKEIGKRGATANLIHVAKGAETRLAAPLRFFLSGHSAYVDAQPVHVGLQADAPEAMPLSGALEGKVALVTGGARGIGAATAERLAAEGAHVVCLDIPADEETLNATVAKIGGAALPMDITDPSAPEKIATYFKEQHGGVDIVVHNAGVTRDKTLANMKEHLWDMVLSINLGAILAIDEVLLGDKVINDGGRIVCLSSIGGIAGNMGQTNYGATKAGLIGYVAAQSAEQAKRGITVNAVAPGFIETRMTAEMPFMIREAGRRMNSLSQGGHPEDVAELIKFLSTPGAVGITGQTIRVCGQSLIGA